MDLQTQQTQTHALEEHVQFKSDRKLQRLETADLWDVFIFDTTPKLRREVHNELKDKNKAGSAKL